MAARHGLVPLRWTAEQTNDPLRPHIAFRHVKGPTRGMDVEWLFTPLDGGRDARADRAPARVPVSGRAGFLRQIRRQRYLHPRRCQQNARAHEATGGKRGSVMHRVAVTGLGVVTPLGIGIEPFWNNVAGGKRRGPHHHALSDGRLLLDDRGRDRRLRCIGVHRRKAAALDRSLLAVRHGRHAFGDRGRRVYRCRRRHGNGRVRRLGAGRARVRRRAVRYLPHQRPRRGASAAGDLGLRRRRDVQRRDGVRHSRTQRRQRQFVRVGRGRDR